MKVIEYEDRYVLSLIDMFLDYFTELHGDQLIGNKVTIEGMIRDFKENKSIYLLLDNNRPIGFMVGYLNDQYGMVQSHIVCEYQYIKEGHRNGKAILYLTHALAEICTRLELGIVNTTYNTSSSTHNMERLGATIHSTTSILTAEQARKIYKKYTRRIIK